MHNYGKRWYSEIPHSVVKRKFGEFVRATKKENMYHEAKLKYIFYNAMIYYDMTGIPIWKNRNLHNHSKIWIREETVMQHSISA